MERTRDRYVIAALCQRFDDREQRRFNRGHLRKKEGLCISRPVARAFETPRTQGATKVPQSIAILTRPPSDLEGSNNPAMSQEYLRGPFVVLGDLCVSRRGCRQPEGIESEDWFHRIDEETCKLLNCSRLRERTICSLGAIKGPRGSTERGATLPAVTALKGKLEARPYNGPSAVVAASFQLAILVFRVSMSLGSPSRLRIANGTRMHTD